MKRTAETMPRRSPRPVSRCTRCRPGRCRTSAPRSQCSPPCSAWRRQRWSCRARAHFYAWDEPRLFFSVDVYTCKAFDPIAAVAYTERVPVGPLSVVRDGIGARFDPDSETPRPWVLLEPRESITRWSIDPGNRRLERCSTVFNPKLQPPRRRWRRSPSACVRFGRRRRSSCPSNKAPRTP